MKQKPPLYTLAHGIEVVGEYPASGKNRYARLRIRPHRFFPHVKNISGGIYVRKSRVILAAKLGRALLPSEHAHHDDENRDNDSESNIELLSAAEHNRHHKTGTTHRSDSKAKTSASLKKLYADGVRVSNLQHKTGEESHNAKLNWEKVRAIRRSSETQQVLADRYGVSSSNIGFIRRNKSWVE